MRTVSIVVVLLASLSQPGCSGGGDAAGEKGGSSSNGPNAANDPSQNGSNPSPSSSSNPSNPSNNNNNTSPDCTENCSENPDGGSSTPADPTRVLHIVSAHQSGRAGEDIMLTFEGTSVDASAFALRVGLADQSGNEVLGFRNWSGVPAAAKRAVLFDRESAVGTADFKRVVTLHGFMRDFPTIRKINAAFIDATGASNELDATVDMQSVKNLNQACDPNIVLDRCASGLACTGASSPKCVKPSPPSLTSFAYVTSDLGAQMLFAGNSPADDLNGLHLEFLDNAGNPVQVDMTGNKDFKTSFDVPIAGVSQRGEFFYTIESAPSFSASVTQLAATPMGLTGNGARVTALLSSPTVAALGQSCDLRGFATCGGGNSCVSGTCTELGAARTAAFAKATKLDPTLNKKLATGYAVGDTVWGDPPGDCIPAGLHDLPEAAVHLHLAHGMSSVTLTTDNEETNGKMAIFVLPGTGASVGTTPLGCASGSPANLSLSNVSGGDYTVVVASMRQGGSNFGVSIK